MASVAIGGFPHHRHHASMASPEPSHLPALPPTIEMVPNPTFSFPMQPAKAKPAPLIPSPTPQDTRRRPVSMQIRAPAQPASTSPHKRTTSALPSFSFNAGDASGLVDEASDAAMADEAATTPSVSVKRGHRRGGSEFVGGDSRFGVSNAISSSPTKTETPSLPVPIPTSPHGARRGHAHRRSEALSSRDLGRIMSPADLSPRLSSSLPSTPLEHPGDASTSALDRSLSAPTMAAKLEDSASVVDDSPTRPPSRPRVEFVDKVEFIPRPLSTISSETEGSYNTIRGHSVNNSISSVISLSASGSPSSRTRTRATSDISVSSTAEPRSKARSSIEISKRIEKEGEWLKSRSACQETHSPPTECDDSSTVRPSTGEPAVSFKVDRRKQKSLSLRLDRRRSEPSISALSTNISRLSALSLQETMLREAETPLQQGHARAERRSSKQKLKDWALSMMHRKYKEHRTLGSTGEGSEMRPESAESLTVPGKVPISHNPVAETDLDAVFGNETAEDGDARLGTPIGRIEFNSPPCAQRDSSGLADCDDASPVVDLDAALGPMRTPPMGSGGYRRQLHSSRMGKSLSSQGGHFHRRAESEPALAIFEHGRTSTPSQTSMEDVFEVDEEDESVSNPANRSLAAPDDEEGVGVSVVDADPSAFGIIDGREELRLNRSKREQERPHTSYACSSSRLSVPIMDRPASLVEEIIVEESSPVDASREPMEIVELHEEPRAPSLTKSSDSSDASTVLAAPSTAPTASDDTPVVMTPDTFPNSTFSSPDFARRQGSFDTSRVGTSASSITDNRTMSSYTTTEPCHEVRMSVDDVPSLTSSRSTMMSTMHANNSRRELSDQRLSSGNLRSPDATELAQRRKKRASIQSLSQLVGGTFGPRAKASEEFRPRTAAAGSGSEAPKKKEHRLKKLMFWRSKQFVHQSQAANKLHKEP